MDDAGEMRAHGREFVELACVVGFWKFYNTVHDSLHIPIEAHLLPDTGYVNLA